MARPSWADIEDAFNQPTRVLDALPDSTERRSAERHLKLSHQYAMECREKVRNAEPDPEPAADAAVTMTDGVFWTTCYRLEHLHVHQGGACSVAG